MPNGFGAQAMIAYGCGNQKEINEDYEKFREIKNK